MSKTDAHIINAEAGDVISVELEIEKGKGRYCHRSGGR